MQKVAMNTVPRPFIRSILQMTMIRESVSKIGLDYKRLVNARKTRRRFSGPAGLASEADA